MAGELEKAAGDLMAALDAKDVDRVVESFGEEAQGVDEISRRWLRGSDEVDSYLHQMIDAVSDVRSKLGDAQERIWGDVGSGGKPAESKRERVNQHKASYKFWQPNYRQGNNRNQAVNPRVFLQARDYAKRD